LAQNSLIESDIPQYWSPAEVANWLILHGDDNAFTLPPNTIFSWISSSKYSFSHKDLNMDILFILQAGLSISVSFPEFFFWIGGFNSGCVYIYRRGDSFLL
jgi:hypothetical protein